MRKFRRTISGKQGQVWSSPERLRLLLKRAQFTIKGVGCLPVQVTAGLMCTSDESSHHRPSLCCLVLISHFGRSRGQPNWERAFHR